MRGILRYLNIKNQFELSLGNNILFNIKIFKIQTAKFVLYCEKMRLTKRGFVKTSRNDWKANSVIDRSTRILTRKDSARNMREGTFYSTILELLQRTKEGL